MEPMDDVTLLEAWREGDNAAGRKLVGRYYEPIYRFLFGKVADTACEDLTQETFEVLIRRREGYRGEGPFRAYLYGVARFVLIAHIRRRRRHRERFEPAEHSAVDPATEGASAIFAAREHERIVAAALRSLPLDDQITIELKDWEGLTQDELAALFEVPRSTMASRISRARARLRQAIEAGLADPAQLAQLEEGLDTCMRSIQGKIRARLEGTDSEAS
jgi:RNA polymerase sigma factor (sigma-70 family)